MSNVDLTGDHDATRHLLAAAAKAVMESRYCWLLTAAIGASASARPMGLVARALDPDDWKLSFVTDGRSRKAQEIRRAQNISLTFQQDADDAFVKLCGNAAIQDHREDVSRRWKTAYDRYFPTETDRGNAMFVDVRIGSMDLWIRGVTPEPFGLQATTLEREGDGPWRLVEDRRQNTQ